MVKRKGTPKKAKSRPQTTIFLLGKRQFNVTVKTLKEIRRLQMTTTNCVPKAPFSRLVREIMLDLHGVSYKMQASALAALQEAAEIYLVQLFEDANKCSAHAKRITLSPVDIALTLVLRGCLDPGYNIV